MALVLCTGRDRGLLETRRMILENAGHMVVQAATEPEVVAACEGHKFDVAVIGQAVSPAGKQGLASRIRERCQSVKILELYAPYQGKTIPDADAWLEVPAAVPSDLVERVAELARQDQGAKR